MKLVMAVGECIVFSNGIYRIDYRQRRLMLLLEDKIERATEDEGLLIYTASNKLTTYNLNQPRVVSSVDLANPLSALNYNEGYLCYSEWNSKFITLRKDSR